MTTIEQIIEEFEERFEERAESLMKEYEIDPPGINYGAVRDNLSYWLSNVLTSLQESTESRVREELRAAVDNIPIQRFPTSLPIPATAEEMRKAVLTLLQDPKKQ